MSEISLKSGLKALWQKKYKEVHSQCIDVLKKDKSNSKAFFLLGVIAYDHKNFIKAEELFLKSEKLDPTDPHYPAFLARMMSELKQPELAKTAADRAAASKIQDGYLADMLGVVYSRTGFHELAIKAFEQAVELDPFHANFFYNLGASNLFLGNFETARTAFHQATKLDPNHFSAFSSLIALDKQTATNNHLDHLKSLYERLASQEDATHQLGHAIAKTLEDLGEHEESLTWLRKAKTAKYKKYGYNRVAGQKTFEAAKGTVNITSSGFRSATKPIFIVGLPRTGTTMVDRILSSHSKVRSAGELNFFADIIKRDTNTASNLVLDADTLRASSTIGLENVGQTYLKRVQNRLGDLTYVIDKMPFNFFYAALITQALPDARIVALRRGAMDSCLSNYRQLLSVQQSFYNYTFDLGDIAFFYRQFDELITHWREHLSSEQFMEIRYEDIVFDQEHQTHELLNFCGLDFEEACLRFHENTAPVSTASSVQVRQPLYTSSIGRWKKYGNKLDDLRDALGELAD